MDVDVLFDFLVYGYLLENPIVLLEFKPLSGVLFVLGGDVTRGAGHAAVLMLGTLHNHLNPITFLGHFGWKLILSVQR
jgi:hypothetical protein